MPCITPCARNGKGFIQQARQMLAQTHKGIRMRLSMGLVILITCWTGTFAKSVVMQGTARPYPRDISVRHGTSETVDATKARAA
eukprot:scaffold158120_cov41-Tisochrysis_lutea.AAC.6